MNHSISAIGSQQMAFAMRSTNGATAVRGPERPRAGGGPNMDTVLAPVSELLGTSVSDLRTAMASGATLDSIAADAGLAHDDLVAALQSGIEQDRAAQGLAATTPTGEVFDVGAFAEMMASGVGPTAGPSGPPPMCPPHGENGADQALLDSVASSLDLGADELVAALMDGTSLSELATRQGVAMSSVLDALGRGMSGMVVDTTM